jgi:tetratricopeptide (TPR) repeat protein
MSSAINDTLQQALTHARSGNLAEAEKLCEHLLAQPVVESEGRHLLGVIRNIQNRFAEAEPLLSQAVAEQPAIAKHHSSLGNAQWGLGRIEDAELSYRRALALDPGFDDARVNLAKLLHVVDDRDAAIAEYQQLIRNNPQNVTYYPVLAFLLESTNRLDEARRIAQAGLDLEPANPTINLAMAICDRSVGKLDLAMQRFGTIDPAALETRYAASFYCERGLLHDRLEHIDAAFSDFATGNSLQAQDAQQRGFDKARYLDELERTAQLDVSWLDDRPPAPGEPPAPVFLVGFPRSGTTLLDQILDSHANIQTMEEKPVLNRLCNDIDALIHGKPEGLGSLNAEQITLLRRSYFEYAADFIELQPGNLLIDKFPLNITRIPLILRVFPDARFILALRHPCDCVLSCYMHLFGPNDAMANFYTLEDTAAMYARVMGLWRQWADTLPLRHHRVYYEHLVQDLPGEIKPLLDFLGLDWREEMARPHEHAARRGFINTPSRSQVIQPIYKRASGRWHRYLPYLGDVMGTLQPYIDYFGYDDEADQPA